MLATASTPWAVVLASVAGGGAMTMLGNFVTDRRTQKRVERSQRDLLVDEALKALQTKSTDQELEIARLNGVLQERTANDRRDR